MMVVFIAFAALCLKVHFETTMFEQGRADGKRKLKPNAVPTLFKHAEVPHHRKPPTLRGSPLSAAATAPWSRLPAEHSYSKPLTQAMELSQSSGEPGAVVPGHHEYSGTVQGDLGFITLTHMIQFIWSV